jgi:hypothetical protein
MGIESNVKTWLKDKNLLGSHELDRYVAALYWAIMTLYVKLRKSKNIYSIIAFVGPPWAMATVHTGYDYIFLRQDTFSCLIQIYMTFYV